jgi:hypothetical protein
VIQGIPWNIAFDWVRSDNVFGGGQSKPFLAKHITSAYLVLVSLMCPNVIGITYCIIQQEEYIFLGNLILKTT